MNRSPQWQPEYSVQNQAIDRQHQYLFELVAVLETISLQRENRLSVREALKSLFAYAELHFSTEEPYYRNHPEFHAHQQLHREFVAKTREFDQAFQRGTLDLDELIIFLYDWLVDHIVETDVRYFREMAATRQVEAVPGGQAAG